MGRRDGPLTAVPRNCSARRPVRQRLREAGGDVEDKGGRGTARTPVAPRHRFQATLLAVLCWTRTAETTDGLVDPLIALVHRIGTRAERPVEAETLIGLTRVQGNDAILLAVARAALAKPDDTVRAVIFPVVGEDALARLVTEPDVAATFGDRARRAVRASYSAHYRRMLPHLLGTMEFRCNNASNRPVMDAIELCAALQIGPVATGTTTPTSACRWREFLPSRGDRPWSTTRGASSGSPMSCHPCGDPQAPRPRRLRW